MAIVASKATGKSVTIGSFAAGYPTQTTWGTNITAVDAGMPLVNYSSLPTDPLKLWKTQPSLRKVVGFAAREFAMVPWHAYQRVDDNDRVRRSQSPAEQILVKPENLVDGYMLLTALATDAMIFDQFMAVLIDDELVRIPPSMINIKSDAFGRPRQIIIMMPQGLDDLDVTDVPKVVGWGWHPTKAGGVSPMYTLAALLEENLRAVDWRTQQWRAMPKVAGFLKRPAAAHKWQGPQKDSFLESWRAWRTNPGAGTPILEDGMEYESIDSSITPKNAQDIEGRRLTDIEVASAFYIPPELVGAREGTFSNIDAFRQMLFGPTLGPLFVQMQQAFNNGGIVESLDVTPNLYVEPNREAAMEGSFIEQARVLQSAIGGPFMLRAEGRSRFNLPFIPGTDELIVPLNVVEGGQASPTDSGSQNVGGDNADPAAQA
ncbi:phage portal protein [Demequina capsici]|uniref:Phage portal protein n=1 Tax=Demequina capsici TaxID=3075620 RepID=A0AA96FFL5_9MICO|nr:phage portal protein [Demequina sp. PMTSA13]WNM27545.1 phage portal protein [Demequina sp. PMTSA13]